MNSELVSVNGIVQSRQEYMVNGPTLVFHQAPPVASEINIYIDGFVMHHTGNGSTVTFDLPNSPERIFKQFMLNVWEHRQDPAVKDQLEKLKVVMELIR